MWILFKPLFRIFNPNFFQQLDCPRFCFFLRQLIVFQHSFYNLVSNGNRGIQGCHGILEHHGNMASAYFAAYVPRAHLGNIRCLFLSVFIPPAVMDGTVVNMLVITDNAHNRFHGNRLTASAFPYNCYRFPSIQVKTHSPDGCSLSMHRIKGNFQIPN